MTTLFGMKEKKDKAFGKFAGKGSFAERMMAKMGYKEGSGLGKYDQGMINPVEAVLRKKGTGLGASGTERTKQRFLFLSSFFTIRFKSAAFPDRRSDSKSKGETGEKRIKGTAMESNAAKSYKEEEASVSIQDRGSAAKREWARNEGFRLRRRAATT